MGIATKIDITPADLKTLQALLKRFIPQTTVWAFGSRVKFTNKPSSDLDLVAFTTKEQNTLVSLLKDAIEEAMLPYRVDLLCWHEIPENFKKNIEQQYVVVQQAETNENSLPKGWKIYKLGEITKRIGDGLHGTPKYDENGDFYFINGSNLVNGKIVINSNTQKVNKTEFDKHQKDLSDKTILLGINGTIGNVALYNNEKCILGKSAAYLNIKDDFDKQFVRYVLTNDHFQNFIKTNASGTTIKNVGLGLLREYEFSAPKDKTTQTAIAQILSSLDDKIELNLQMNQTLEAMAQAIFKEWFVDFKFPGFDGELLNGLPKGWRKMNLSELVDTVSKTHKFPKGKAVFLNTSDILDGSFLHSNYSDFDTLPGQAKKTIQYGDILFSEIRPANRRYAFVDFEATDYVVSTKLMVLRSKGIVDSLVVYFFMKSNEVLNQLQLLAESRSGTFPQITYTELAKIELNIPSADLLKLYTEYLWSAFKKIRENQSQIQTLTQTRDALLPKLMSGQIAVV